MRSVCLILDEKNEDGKALGMMGVKLLLLLIIWRQYKLNLWDNVTISETERNLDEALRDGDFDLIQKNVTPKTLTNCKTNALLKAFQVSCVVGISATNVLYHTLP